MTNLTARIKDYVYGCDRYGRDSCGYGLIGKYVDFDIYAIAVKKDGVKIVILVEGELKTVNADDFYVSVKNE